MCFHNANNLKKVEVKMEDKTLREIWKEEEKIAFLDWDFLYFDNRWKRR